MPESLIIGVGGAGAVTCRRLAERIASLQGAGRPEILVLDTDQAIAEVWPPPGSGAAGPALLTASAAMLDTVYRSPERFHAEWINPEVLRGRGSAVSGTRGNRMLGRFLLLLPENRAQVQSRVREWLARGSGHRRVWVVAGAAGGTGGGQVTDLGYLLRELAASAEVELEQRAILFVPPPADEALAPNALAALTELHYFADPNTRYRAHLRDDDTAFETRQAPYDRVSLLTSLTGDGAVIPLEELQERTAVYLLTACMGDAGNWDTERREQERLVPALDMDGNPQTFGTFGTEWVEYPEERLVNSVYRNLLRRSLIGWLHGDRPAQISELPNHVPLKESAGLARLITEVYPEQGPPEQMIQPIRTRLPWIHKGAQNQWATMDREVETEVIEAIGVLPGPGRRAKGPLADRARSLRDRALNDFQKHSQEWLRRDGLSLDRVARVLTEAAADITTITDPTVQWEAARDRAKESRQRLLWTANALREDPWMLFNRGVALKKVAREYERIAGLYILHSLNSAALPFMREIRGQVQEQVRCWAARVGAVAGILSALSRAWADEESAYLERLRRDDEQGRLALGLLRLPGKETPYVANSGWDLPYARAEEEPKAIFDLRDGWIERLVDKEDGLVAVPGRSVLDGGAERMRESLDRIDRELRGMMQDRLRGWLSATAFQRLAEQYRNPVDLEFQLRRMVGTAADLPALEPPHARPEGFPMEYELVFFGEAKSGDLPSALRMVVDTANRERPTHVVPSRSAHYLTAVTEHAGFSLARCPAYFQLADTVLGSAPKPARPGAAAPRPELPFNRRDIPWRSASLVTRVRLQDASDVLFLALALGILHPIDLPGEGAGGRDAIIPLPQSTFNLSEAPLPLPGEFDLAVRQLAGDTEALEGVGLAVDRSVQAKGVEWCSLQVERVLHGEIPLRVRFPGADAAEQERAARLVALRAVARYDQLREELSQSPAGIETEWLRVGNTHTCPACHRDLGPDPDAIPGACPACRAPLVLRRITGAVASDGFRRIPNPYVVGTPLETRASVFMGREDIIQQVRERLVRPAQRTILILIGERRSGKTSALKQLQYRLEGALTPLFVDMQGLTASDLSGFLWWLAWRMKEALDERGIQVDLPTFEEFSSGPPDFQFETVILPEIRRKLNGGRVLLMLDEFEVLAQRVMKGTFDSRAFDYLRHLMQHSDGLEFLFAGTHILRQFAANYVTFLFNIGVFLEVDFLKPEDSLRLIQEPVAASGVTFTKDALDSILEMTGAHAYFTQMFGFHLVERMNRLRKRHITREDVEAESEPVIAAASAHLDHVWGQLNDSDRLLISYFVEYCPRGQSCREDQLLQSAAKEDPTLRPFLFRTAVEKLITVGLLRAGTTDDEEGRPVRTLSLTAEVYRQWLLTQHTYSRLREAGLVWS